MSIYSQIPPVIAHRGASQLAPENTGAAIQMAAQMGASWCEVDVTISADGVAVIHHDADLARCSNGTGLVIQKTLAQLRELDMGSWFSKQFAGEKILTLTELLALANKLHLGLNLEIKPTLGREAQTLAAMVSAFQHVPPKHPILLSSFNPYALHEAKRQLPQYPRALNTEAIPNDWQARLHEVDAIGLHFQLEFFAAKEVKALREAGFFCMVFTVNQPEIAQRLLLSGVSAVFSDHPQLLSTSYNKK